MEIIQIYDEPLAHASYAVISDGLMAVVDPARDPAPYFSLASAKKARIVAVIETHPHADFVSSHKEIGEKTGAPVYVSRLVGADYPHRTFDTGQTIRLGSISLNAVNTPGHSPDSISVIVRDETGKDKAVFTGDTLFIGDVGRPDLRESAGNITAKREELARQMYRSTRDILMKLGHDVIVYPAHGAGSLCGKALSRERSSTIGKQLQENYALREMSENEFVDILLEDQPFIPKYFGYDVGINKSGAGDYEKNIGSVPRLKSGDPLQEGILVVDTRSKELFNAGHLPGAVNIIEDGRFETWLGAIVRPGENFYLVARDRESLESVIRRSAKIGYEKMIAGALLNPSSAQKQEFALDLEKFKNEPDAFTIVDVRNTSETRDHAIFSKAKNIPLYELRERIGELPSGRPIVVYCAGGYRSAAAASIIRREIPGAVCYDLGEKIREFRASVASSLE
jgi:glyoxylase-like metal-dependent hydrolase (beta-lactamase superfamily II)/rhodanese-related sulfurtransferase